MLNSSTAVPSQARRLTTPQVHRAGTENPEGQPTDAGCPPVARPSLRSGRRSAAAFWRRSRNASGNRSSGFLPARRSVPHRPGWCGGRRNRLALTGAYDAHGRTVNSSAFPPRPLCMTHIRRDGDTAQASPVLSECTDQPALRVIAAQDRTASGRSERLGGSRASETRSCVTCSRSGLAGLRVRRPAMKGR
jgi:hypothetical protein